MHFVAAYKHADGKKIDGRRVLVDVERARTVKGWRPRRLGEDKYRWQHIGLFFIYIIVVICITNKPIHAFI